MIVMRKKNELDQADGLRRLLVGNQTRIVSIVAGKAGVGRTSMAINLAAALARAGKDVLVLDENHAPNNLSGRLMLSGHFDLLDVAQGRCDVHQAVQHKHGFSVLSAARVMSAINQLQLAQQIRLQGALTEVGEKIDVLLVDGALFSGIAAPSSSLAAGVSLLVVVDATASGITESYALIKYLALENAKLNFEIVVNKVNSEKEAMTVFANMEKVSRQHLAASLEYAGYIPYDEKLKRATQLGRAVVEAFPMATSSEAYVGVAQQFLHFPVQLGEPASDLPSMMQSLMRQMHGSGMGQVASRDHVYR